MGSGIPITVLVFHYPTLLHPKIKMEKETNIFANCPRCGTPVAATVKHNTAGGVTTVCHKCSRNVTIVYSYSNGFLRILNIK